jgi:predicted aminopeptidase
MVRRARFVAALASALLLVTPACTGLRFVSQATLGQLDLVTSARPIDEVIADPKTTPKVRSLLAEVVRVKDFGSEHGLSMHENYEEYVELDRPFVVWFVTASEPLAFIPKTFTFPVVGSFPGLSWFDEADAREFAQGLEADGWDVFVRGVGAYSTGGWFDDPIVSSMFVDVPGGLGFLVNVVLHESFHATVLVGNQQYFNESMASFVANQLTPVYLTQRFGSDSTELRDYLQAQATNEIIIAILAQAVQQLNDVYMSPLPDEQKLREKARITHELQARLQLPETPNNASLIGFSLYHEGEAEMKRLLQTCPSWPAFIRAVGSLTEDQFPMEQSPVIGPVFDLLTARDCRPLPRKPYATYNRPLRQQQQRQLLREQLHRRDVKPPR